MTIAREILNQIKALDFFAMGAWGAKDLVAMDDGLKFKTSGMTPWKGHVYIKYNAGTDLYDIEFFRIRKLEVKTDKKIVGVFVEDLVKTIDKFVG